MFNRRLALTLAGILASVGGAHAATNISFWHSMEGPLGERVNALTAEFNAGQSDYVVHAVYKGAYGESMNAGIAAFRAGNAPDVLQVFEVGTATMMAAKALRAAGLECGYSTAWPSWIQLENFGAWHNTPYATENNGFGGPSARLRINQPQYVKHLGFLAQMAKDGTFTYGGRGDAGNALFTSGKCGMYTGSSGMRASIIKTGQFAFGTSPLPYYDDIDGAPQNSIIGGASLWVFANKSPETYKGVTQFFKFLSSPEKAAAWHQDTGYVPVTKAGYALTQQSGFYDKNVGTEVAVKQLDAATTEHSRGIRLGYLPQIRDIEDSLMEQVFAGKLSPQDALDTMVRRGNELLERFEKSVS